ncbi:MAG: KH domain-containing protein [Victivallales bacterium]|nr:KH domain-containing protein [Victivallales bacterium]
MSIEEQKQKALKTLATMLDYLGLEASLRAEEKNSRISIIVSSEDAGRIIGRKGQALENLQLLLNRMMFKGDQEFPKIMIDIDGYARKDRKPRRPDERDDRDGDRGRDRGRGRDGEFRGDAANNDPEHELRLEKQALDAAKEVKRWGDSVTLPPLNAHDRRIIHITLQDDEEIITESHGDGARKSVVISLKK